MAVNLLDLAKGALTPDLMQKVSALIGESPANTQKAVDGVILQTGAYADLVGEFGRLAVVADQQQIPSPDPG
jgi:hypothetical protein